MVTIREAIEIAQKAYPQGFIKEKDGTTEITDIDLDSGYYGFLTNPEPGEEYNTSMLCVSKKTGEVCWFGAGYLFATCDMTKIIKAPV